MYPLRIYSYVGDLVVVHGSTCCTSGYTLDNDILNGIYIGLYKNIGIDWRTYEITLRFHTINCS